MSASLPPPLPELHQAELTWAQVADLVADVDALCPAREVRLKGLAGPRADAGTVDLAGAHAALVAGRAAGVQIRYVHAGVLWCDTLLRTATGVRLVRIAQPTAGGSP